jgi:hypothetical protein
MEWHTLTMDSMLGAAPFETDGSLVCATGTDALKATDDCRSLKYNSDLKEENFEQRCREHRHDAGFMRDFVGCGICCIYIYIAGEGQSLKLFDTRISVFEKVPWSVPRDIAENLFEQRKRRLRDFIHLRLRTGMHLLGTGISYATQTKCLMARPT